MKKSKFLISSLAAAGFGSVDHQAAALAAVSAGDDGQLDNGKVFRLFKQDHLVTLAQHRSHRSHRSHSSHRSSSGGYRSPAPVYVPPAPAPVYRPPAPAPVYRTPRADDRPAPVYAPPVGTAPPQLETRENLAPQRSLSGRSTQFTSIVRRVQIGLLGQGLYEGAIDGVVGPQLRSAIRAFQSQTGLQITGTITPEVLDALRVSSQ